ncbi:hypothetical protein THTE_0739 [Thermogutta terrifontis]|uniref:Uncharacterized protein n=1 Tax=Thermogutta terrifontis TaxID=1331910 RepID=A0A286RBK3_9BACT|nr:hypothetical protein THTE_0739 [Thermogutta terrifontis]
MAVLSPASRSCYIIKTERVPQIPRLVHAPLVEIRERPEAQWLQGQFMKCLYS